VHGYIAVAAEDSRVEGGWS